MLFRQLFDQDSSTYTYLIADTDRQDMNNLDLPDPKKMMEAVPANELCGRAALVA